MTASPYDIELRRDFKNDRRLVDQILALTRGMYVSNTELVEREIGHNRDIYLIAARDELLAFFMVNFEPAAGGESCYLGLSACREDLKGRGLVTSLYRRFLNDCRAEERRYGRRYLLWWTTASPIVYYWFNRYAARVQPDMDGTFDAAGAAIAQALRGEKYPAVAPDPHPFILRGAAGRTVYSADEQARLSAAAGSLAMDVFRKFDLREENADRFLMIGYAPD